MIEREPCKCPEFGERPPLAVIILLGSGLESTKSGMTGWWEENPQKPLPKQSWDERMRIAATAQLYKELSDKGYLVKIVGCGGKVYSDFPELSRLMREELVRKHGIPWKQSIIEAGPSLNTVEDIEQGFEVLRVFKEKEIVKKAFVVSNVFHLVAAVESLRKGLSFKSAEKILWRRDKRYRKIIRGILLSSEGRELFSKQIAGAGLLLIKGEEKYKERAGREPGGEKAGKFNPGGLPGKKKNPVVK